MLADGRVLIAGGCADSGCPTADRQPSSEFYIPGRGFVVGPPMLHPRDGHTATALADGRVLIVGGWVREGTAPLEAAELFDPATGTFELAGTLHVGRGGHTATVMRDGRVLITGGWTGSGPGTVSVEIFDPATGSFMLGPDLPQPRDAAAGLALPDGSVLVTGGRDGPDHGVSSTVIFDPGLGVWRPGPPMTSPRFKHAITALDDRRVLVLGGTTDDIELLAGTEVLDLATNQFAPGPAMTTTRYKFPDAVAMTSTGRLVVAGGTQVDVLAADGRMFSPVTGTAGSPRSFATATALPDGTVLVIGGYDDRIRVHEDAIIIRPDP
jgi:Galactose oxidase, central domain